MSDNIELVFNSLYNFKVRNDLSNVGCYDNHHSVSYQNKNNWVARANRRKLKFTRKKLY